MRILVGFFLILFTSISAFAQNPPPDNWFRVQSDNGEFSIEVPSNYSYFYDQEGSSLEFSEMSIVNSYFEHTLLSFESFKRRSHAIDAKNQLNVINSTDSEFLDKQKYKRMRSEINRGEFKIEQVVYKGDNQYSVRQYLFSENYIYILTASSRLGETPAMKHFLDSLIFKPNTNPITSPGKTRFPILKETPIVIEENLAKVKTVSTDSPPGVKPLFIIFQPTVRSKFSPARNFLGGTVRLKISFSNTGQISNIVVLEKLMPNFRRDVILTVLRMKFLPPEKDDIPMSVTKTIEYDFGLN